VPPWSDFSAKPAALRGSIASSNGTENINYVHIQYTLVYLVLRASLLGILSIHAIANIRELSPVRGPGRGGLCCKCMFWFSTD
jgi:hypothetical protein